jgi:hypothetical protein
MRGGDVGSERLVRARHALASRVGWMIPLAGRPGNRDITWRVRGRVAGFSPRLAGRVSRGAGVVGPVRSSISVRKTGLKPLVLGIVWLGRRLPPFGQ